MVRRLAENLTPVVAQAPFDRLRPEHCGLRMAIDLFEALPCEEGFRYEIIDGVIQVSPVPEPFHYDIARNLCRLLESAKAADGRPVFADVRLQSRVFVSSERDRASIPEPDVAAYLEYPQKPVRSYLGVSPAVVAEVVSPDYDRKDYVRNVELYGRVASILEYWVVDPRIDVIRPSMAIFRRDVGTQPFARIDIPAGGRYECVRWPGLSVDLARIAVD